MMSQISTLRLRLRAFRRLGLRAAGCALLLSVLLAGQLGQAQLAIYPFNSQETLVGVAVADQIAAAFERELEVFGPALTPSLVPPLVATTGFLNPLVFLNDSRRGIDVASINGVTLLRDSLGASLAVSGAVAFQNERMVLELFVASPQGSERFVLSAPEGNTVRLAERSVQVLQTIAEESFGQSLAPRLEVGDFDLSAAYGDYVRALALAGAGFLSDAARILEEALEAAGPRPRWRRLLNNMRAVLDAEEARDALVAAALGLSSQSLNEQDLITYFERYYDESSSPLAQHWVGILKSDINDRLGANQAFEAADYPFGRAANAMYRAVNSLENAQEILEGISADDNADAGSLLAASFAAQQLEDTTLEQQLLRRIITMLPGLTYPYERLSFIAFDEDDPMTAAETLRIASSLAPESDLYWTNLGWAYYLLGLLEQSEEASLQAVALSSEQYIAWYNLGLVQTVTGRLEAALESYQRALALDPEVEDEAVVDLVNALELFPEEAGVFFSLGTLYEAQGRREEAAEAFERYLEAAAEDAALLGQAEQRIRVLRAPPPPIEISDGAALGLGERLLEASPYRPGDRLYPSFEIFTPGFELPREVIVEMSLQRGDEVLDFELAQQLTIPSNAVAFNVSSVGFDLPRDLAADDYRLVITVTADAGRKTNATLEFTVDGEPSLLRQLVSRNVVMRRLEDNSMLYDMRSVSHTSDEELVAVLLEELRMTADQAEEALPLVENGPFEGFSGGELFEQSSAEDVRIFLDYLLLQGSTSDAEFSFVDAYAQWALEGAPRP